MTGLYKSNVGTGGHEYLLMEERITPKSVHNLNEPTKKFVTLNILPKLSTENWFIGKAFIPNKNTGRRVMTNHNILTTEFTLMEETEEEYETICEAIKNFLYNPAITIYF